MAKESKEGLIPIDSPRFSSETQRKLHEQNQRSIQNTLDHVVAAALKYHEESDRTDGLHTARMGKRERELRQAIEDAQRSWDERGYTDEWMLSMLNGE